MNTTKDLSIRNAGLVAGFSILIMAIAAGFATAYVNGSLIVPDDAPTTLANIREGLPLFRAGLLSWVIILICDVLAAWGLYLVLKVVNPGLSLLSAWLRLVYAVFLGVATMNYLSVLQLLNGDAYLEAIPTDLLAAQVMLALQGFDNMWSFGLIIFGGHLLCLGYLLLKATFIPKIWSVLILIASVGYLILAIGDLMIPDFSAYQSVIEMIFMLPMIVGELGLGIWLIVKALKNNLSIHA